MKRVVLLLTTSFVLASSAALAQDDGCSKQYGACMDRCSSRPEQVQGMCSQTCEATTNQCYVGMYGQRPAGGGAPAQLPASVSEPARDAQGSASTPAAASDK